MSRKKLLFIFLCIKILIYFSTISNCLMVFCRTFVLQIFGKLAGKHPRWGPILVKLIPSVYNFITIGLHHWCFPMFSSCFLNSLFTEQLWGAASKLFKTSIPLTIDNILFCQVEMCIHIKDWVGDENETFMKAHSSVR